MEYDHQIRHYEVHYEIRYVQSHHEDGVRTSMPMDIIDVKRAERHLPVEVPSVDIDRFTENMDGMMPMQHAMEYVMEYRVRIIIIMDFYVVLIYLIPCMSQSYNQIKML